MVHMTDTLQQNLSRQGVLRRTATTLLLAITLTAATVGLTPSSAQASTPGAASEDYIKNCGISTCTRYYTRAATERINENVQAQQNRIQNWGEAGPAIACAFAGGAAGAVLSGGVAVGAGAAVAAAACDKLSEGKIGSLIDHLKQAADANQCFAVRTPRVLDRLDVAALYASNYLVRSNEYCTDGS